ncbi:pyridine nucleotide-disulfide oxidoreductase [Orenia metallireducens]|uniref:Pyridine nucleotide-disulfide oxidoreductase n=1 Tax=Orenia metallireducens TaxID=1413210 RepID=A0A1C0A7Y0_9FIRM|nr:FAD-dependent oxidoreductase [Orenia metallireducens]OCL26356.1 pyridine nucleotide-disulfide oxidoreductase [Orenia metallireducens]
MEKIVIVGNGISAINAIKAIREIDKKSSIELFGEEKFYPYNRIRLSKGLLSSLEEDKILLQKKNWYDENNIELYIDKKVKSILPNDNKIELEDGTKIEYSKLLLAQGASNLVPPIKGIDKKSVFTLRGLKDAWNIRDATKSSSKVLIIGGGIQGLEIAWILSKQGKDVTIAEISSNLMPRELDKKAAKILEEAMKEADIEVLLDTEVKEIIGENQVKGFLTKKGKKQDCDMVIYSTGINPNLNVLTDTGIESNRGVLVNDKMETNIANIYASGDVVEFNNRIYGLWNMAIEQGKTAGYNIVGKEETYQHLVPVITLRAFGISLFSMGIIDEDKASNIIIEEKHEDKSYTKILLKDKQVIGAIVIGDIRKSPTLKKAIEEKIKLKNVNFNSVSIEEIIQIIRRNR